MKKIAAAILATPITMTAAAVPTTYDGITFPQGDVSFVDEVISYDPLFGGGPGPTSANYTDPSKAIGAPDYSGSTGSVSLGDGGQIVLKFTDNALTGSNTAAADLHIFEIGSQIEDTFVEISTHGVSYISVGSANGSTSSIDIDPYLNALSIDPFTQFFYVRLTDDTDLDGQTGSTVGADIDAVGAITSELPEPATGTLALAGLTTLNRRRKG